MRDSIKLAALRALPAGKPASDTLEEVEIDMDEGGVMKKFDFRTHDLGLGDYNGGKELATAREDIQAALDMGLITEDSEGRLWITAEGIIYCAEQHKDELSPYFESYIQQTSRGFPR